MPWTYLGPTSDRDRVRLLIGDTEATDPQLQDEEIAWLLAEAGNVYGAAVAACEALAAKYARQVNRSVAGAGGLSVSAGDRAQHYRDLAETLQIRARKARRPVPFAGGISDAQKDAVEADTDRVAPAFTDTREMPRPFVPTNPNEDRLP